MRKILPFLIFALTISFVNAQSGCTPDPAYTAAGIYPDSATGLSSAIVGQSYSENITVITPTDTFVDVPLAGMVNVTIDNIDLTSVTGLPPNFTYTCDPPSCSFAGGTIKCAELYSTVDPVAADIGLYPIIFETTTHVSGVPFIGTTTQDDMIDYYYIEILADNQTSILNYFISSTFELKDAFPVPAKDQAIIQFISGTPSNISFVIYDLFGKQVYNKVILANKGINTINVNTSSLSKGIYMYSINNGERVLTKRMIIGS